MNFEVHSKRMSTSITMDRPPYVIKELYDSIFNYTILFYRIIEVVKK